MTGIKEGPEDARRVKGRAAKPIDGPVGPDEGGTVGMWSAMGRYSPANPGLVEGNPTSTTNSTRRTTAQRR